MLYQLFWKSPVFLMGAMGWPNIYSGIYLQIWANGEHEKLKIINDAITPLL